MITAKCATGESLVMSEETTKFLKLDGIHTVQTQSIYYFICPIRLDSAVSLYL